MKCINLLVAMVFSSSCAFVGANMANDRDVTLGKQAIGFCIKNYEKLAEKSFFNDVDRAYVLATDEKLDVLFSRGEVGTFGKRSKDYRSYLACGVLSTGEMEIYFLAEPLKDALIELLGVKQVSDIPDVEAIDLLFLKSKGGFEFTDSQKFESVDIEVIRPGYTGDSISGGGGVMNKGSCPVTTDG